MPDLVWQKSSFSFAHGNCFEVARDGKTVRVRHSKAPHRELVFTSDEWLAFYAGVQAHEFDHLVWEGGIG